MVGSRGRVMGDGGGRGCVNQGVGWWGSRGGGVKGW